ncbi:MAG TPA: M23 family metallopeptidase [Terriglobia bacterium]|nr:M23 family metallopeptidase [Terriglobia bacterium]
MGIGKCRIGFLWSLLFTVIATVVPRYWESHHSQPAPIPNAAEPAAESAPKLDVVEGSIGRNTTLMATLVGVDVPIEVARRLVQFIEPVFDLRKLRSGNPFRLEKDDSGDVATFEYKIDDESVLKVERAADAYSSRVEKLEFEERQAVVDVEIHGSLFQSLESQDKGELLAMSFAKVFASEVDFNTDIQPQDRVRIVVNELRHDGKLVKYGPIQAAELVNEGTVHRAFLFDGEYYDTSGNSLKRAFLISPLKFEPRITSGFSRARLHPILGKVTAHLAVDYGAPTGAPVVAVGTGTVIVAGWNSGGYGNFIEIKHGNGLVTGYAHLSRIAPGIRAGQSVKQGDLIGYVGQTGLATGPHLHFMTLRGQTALDPRAVLKSSEPGKPIKGSAKAEFSELVRGYQPLLPSLATDTSLAASSRSRLEPQLLRSGAY